MDDDLDGRFALLAAQPLPPRLQGLELQVQHRLEGRHKARPNPALRYAAVGLALVAGLGVGATAATLRQAPPLATDLSGGAQLAPSSLL